VGSVTRCDVTRRREAEANVLTALLSVPILLGLAASFVPVIGWLIGLVSASAVVLAAIRFGIRRLRERRQDREALAAWRAGRELARSST
jgi:hypothetical protein